jgi:hypothetical protein
MAYGRSGRQERERKSEIRDRRSEIISDFKIRNSKLFNPQFAILFAHIRSSLSVLDLVQRLLLEALADGVDQNFLTDPFDKCVKSFGAVGDRPVTGDLNAGGTAQIDLSRPATGEWFLDLKVNGKWNGCGGDACIQFLSKTRKIYPWWQFISKSLCRQSLTLSAPRLTCLAGRVGARTQKFLTSSRFVRRRFPERSARVRTCSAPLRELTTRASRTKASQTPKVCLHAPVKVIPEPFV